MAEANFGEDYSKQREEEEDNNYSPDFGGENDDEENDYDDLFRRYRKHKESDDTLSSAPSAPDPKEFSNLKRSETAYKKKFLKENFNLNVKKIDGKESSKLLESISIFSDKVTGREGLYYNGKFVGRELDGKFEYSKEKIVSIFKENLRSEHGV